MPTRTQTGSHQPGEDFLYVFKPALTGPEARAEPAHGPFPSASLPVGTAPAGRRPRATRTVPGTKQKMITPWRLTVGCHPAGR